MKATNRLLILLATTFLLPAAALGQILDTPNTIDSANLAEQVCDISGKVKTIEGDPVPGTKVEVRVLNVFGQFQRVKTNSQGTFLVEFQVSAERVKELSLDLRASKNGFLAAHEIIGLGGAHGELGGGNKTWEIEVTLVDANEDPSLLSQADLISNVTPRLRKLDVLDLPASAQKDYARGLREFFEQNDSDRALPFLTKVAKRAPACVECRTILGLAKLESGDWDGASRDLSEAVDKTLADRAKGRPESLLIFGTMKTWQHEPKQAASLYLEALKFTPQDPLALQELGRSQFLLENWGAANLYLSKALDAGAGPDARLMRVELLARTGDLEEANRQMTLYLSGREVRKMPPRVRQLWSQIQNPQKQESNKKVASLVERSLDDLTRSIPELRGIEPAADQRQLDSILSAVGKNVAAFFQNFPNTTSLERIHQEQVRRNGKAGRTSDQKLRYLLVAKPHSGGLWLEEYRTDSMGARTGGSGEEDGFVVTAGFASLALAFHPDYQPDSLFRYLGKQDVNGHKAKVVAFAQRPKVARMTEELRINKDSVIILIQGLAWIDSSNSQIVRMRTDLLKPQASIGLRRQTTEIEFEEIRFRTNPRAFWLPRAVTVTLEIGGKTFRNQHAYSDFRLFSVDAEEKRKPLGQSTPRPPSSGGSASLSGSGRD